MASSAAFDRKLRALRDGVAQMPPHFRSSGIAVDMLDSEENGSRAFFAFHAVSGQTNLGFCRGTIVLLGLATSGPIG